MQAPPAAASDPPDIGATSPVGRTERLRESAKVVVAEPRPPRVERRHERVRVLELLQDPLRPDAAGEVVCERPAHALEDGRPQQQLAHLGRLALEHLSHEVAGDSPLAAGELGDEALGVGRPCERDRGEPQAGGPALGPLVQQRHAGVRELDAGGAEELARLLHGEAQIVGPQLGQLAGQAEPVKAELWLLAGRERDVELRRRSLDQPLERRERVVRAELVQVVDHEQRRGVQQREVAEQPLERRVAVHGRCRLDALDQVVGTRERIVHGEPEPLAVALVALDRDPRDAVRRPGRLDPRAQQHGLAAPGRRADEDDAACLGR